MWVSWGGGLAYTVVFASVSVRAVSFDINHARMPSLDKDTSLARVRAQPALSLLALPPSAALVQPLSHPVSDPHRPLEWLLRHVQARRGSDVDLHLCGLWPTPPWSVAQVVCDLCGLWLRWAASALAPASTGRRQAIWREAPHMTSTCYFALSLSALERSQSGVLGSTRRRWTWGCAPQPPIGRRVEGPGRRRALGGRRPR